MPRKFQPLCLYVRQATEEKERVAAAKASESADGASTSWIPPFENISKVLYKEKKSGSSKSESNDTDPDLAGSAEVIIPDVGMRCSGSSEMDIQSGASASLMSNSDVVIKQEIIETEEESSAFDDSSLHSSFADGPAETQFHRQTPSMTHSESSNSNADTLPVGQVHDVAMAQTMSHGFNIVKVESDISTNFCNVSPKIGVLFSNEPSDLNIENSSEAESTQPRISSHVANPIFPSVLNVTDPKSSCSTEPIQPGVSSGTASPPLPQVLNTSSLGSSENNEHIHPGVPTNLIPPVPLRDKFDAYGEFIASKLRNLDAKSCTFVQSAFADLIFKAELGMFLNRGEKSSISAPRTNDTRKEDSLTHNQSESACIVAGKENIQPRAPSQASPCLPPDFNIPDSGRLPRNEPIQPGAPLITNPSFPSVLNITGPDSLVRNEPHQPRIMSHIGNPWPSQVLNVTVPENSSINNSSQTRVSSHVGPQSSPPVLNNANSFNNMPIQSRVPFNMRPRDEFDAYGEFAASKLRTLDPRSCAFVQTAFADLIFEAELGRFLSEGERSIFANKTNEILRHMPPANASELSSLGNVVSNLPRYGAQPQWNFVQPGFYPAQVPLQVIPNLHFVPQ